ncbi:MAG: ECF-type sigma factor [Longimicrobiales bacterium]
MESVTEILIRSRGGRREDADELFSRLYEELKRVAKRQLRSSAGATLDTSALINETYLRVVDQERAGWEDRAHFFAYAARAMRHVLVDRARRRKAGKRGGGVKPLTFTEHLISPDESADVLIELDDALDSLSAHEPRLAQVVDLRFFGGLTEEEAATALEVSARTVRRDWFKAKAFLHGQLGGARDAS